MTVGHTEKAKVNSESYWDKVNARIKRDLKVNLQMR